MAFVSGILLLAVAGITSGEANQEIWDGICLAPVDGGTVKSKVA